MAAVVVAAATYGTKACQISVQCFPTKVIWHWLQVGAWALQQCLYFFLNNPTHESFLEKASTNCMASGGIENEYSLDAMQWRKAVHCRPTILQPCSILKFHLCPIRLRPLLLLRTDHVYCFHREEPAIPSLRKQISLQNHFWLVCAKTKHGDEVEPRDGQALEQLMDQHAAWVRIKSRSAPLKSEHKKMAKYTFFGKLL